MAEKRFEIFWRNKWLTAEAKTLGDMIRMLRLAANDLEEMVLDGVTLDPSGGTEDDHALLVTDNEEIAKKYGFYDAA